MPNNGKLFFSICYATLEQELGLRLYFADPYSSWQRGSNENANGLLREFYPKQTDLTLVQAGTLQLNLALMSSRPRKCIEEQTLLQSF